MDFHANAADDNAAGCTPIAANGDDFLLEQTHGPVPGPAVLEPALGEPCRGLSPARDALRQAITAVRAARLDFETSAEPHRRLEAIRAEAARLDEQLAGHAAEHDRRLGAWLARPEGERPSPAAVTVGLRQRRNEIAENWRAAQTALPEIERLMSAASARMVEAARRLDQAVVIAAVDIAHQTIEAELVPALRAVLAVEARLQGLRPSLFAIANRSQSPVPAASGAAGRIAELIRAAKNEVTAPRDDEAGRQLLAALLRDPAATWGTP